MSSLSLSVLQDERVYHLSTHKTAPAWHPNFTTFFHVEEVIDDHRSLTSRTVHHVLQTPSIIIDRGLSIGHSAKELKWQEYKYCGAILESRAGFERLVLSFTDSPLICGRFLSHNTYPALLHGQDHLKKRAILQDRPIVCPWRIAVSLLSGKIQKTKSSQPR